MRHALALLIGIAVFAQQRPAVRRPPPKPYESSYISVTGVVRDADTGEPIAGARLRVRGLEFGANVSEKNIVTTLGGRFNTIMIRDGSLLLQVQADGYVESPEALERGPLLLLPRPGHNDEAVEIRLHRAAQIEGKLFDRDLEKPVPGVTVRAHWAVLDRGKRVLRPAGVAASSDAEGRFRLDSLPPAEYFLEIVQKEQERIEERIVTARTPLDGYAREYWPGGAMLSAAIPLAVQAGAHFTVGSIFIRQSKLFRLHGELVSPICRPTMRYRTVLWEHREERFVLRTDTDLRCNSAFTLHNLTPGDWTLETELRGVLPQDAEASSVDFTVKEKDMDLALHPLPPLQITGKLRGATPKVAVLLRPSGRPEYVPSEVPVASETGEFTLLAPATEFVEVSLHNLPDEYCIRESLYNGNTTNDGLFRVNRDAPTQRIEITLSDKPAMLSGKVTLKEKPVPGAIVVAAPWPVALRTEWPKTLRATAADNGTFAMKGITPGVYRVFAVQPSLRLRLEQPGFLLGLIGRADEHTLGEAENTTVELKPVEP